jgi:predicted lipoprotein
MQVEREITMTKRILCAALTVVMAATLFTGCVKVVKIGEEGSLTGEVEFNPGDSVETIWDSEVIPECEGKAVEIKDVLDTANGNLTGLGEEFDGLKTKSATYYNYAVKVEGATITAVDKDSFYKTITLSIPDYEGDATVTCQIGKYKGSSIRDDMSFINFADFTNQTEWGQINTTMLEKVEETVVAPVFDDLTEGATIDLVGCFTADSKTDMVITPVVLTVN